MRDLPQPRYIVKERGRRLITIDTRSGEAIGLAAGMGAAARVAAAAAAVPPAPVPATDVAAAAPVTPVNAPTRPAASPPKRASASPWGGTGSAARPAPKPTAAADGRAGRVLVVAVAGFIIAIILIVTSLWPFLAIALLLAPTRRLLVDTIARRIIAYIQDEP